jgi:hypothetical protein
MANRKYHILHGKSNAQRDALLRNPGLSLLHANAAGFNDYEQNPGRRQRLGAIENPLVSEEFAGSKKTRKSQAKKARASRKKRKAEGPKIVVGKSGIAFDPSGRMIGDFKVKLPEGYDLSTGQVVRMSTDPHDPSFGADPEAAASAKKQVASAKSAASQDKSDSSDKKKGSKKKGRVKQKSAPVNVTGADFIRDEQETVRDAAAQATPMMRAGSAPQRPQVNEPTKDIIDRLAEGIGNLADRFGGVRRIPKGSKGAATKDTIVGFEPLATLKALKPEQAARIGYQLGVIRGIDTCGIMQRGERRRIKEEASRKLQRAIDVLETNIIKDF